jgi:SAM-dependent methyltransferase
MMQAEGPNAEQITYWNETSGPKWVALEELLDPQIAPLGLEGIERAGVRGGERVLDVGCGCGQTSLQLGERVGAEGSVLGVDLSAPMLARARARARAAGLAQVRFENADAQTFPFEPRGADVVFSRFGVMFFADPVQAFANLRRALLPGGRLAFVCWQRLDRNPWMLLPAAAAARHLPMPPPPAPGAPGPFAFAEADFVRGILERAGLTRIEFTSLERELLVGGAGPLERAVSFLLQMGPAGTALREAAAQDPGIVDRVAASVREALAPFAGPGGLRMPSASWIVSARAPE